MPLKADTITKDYVKDVGVFADIFNYYIYGGRQVILPEQLTGRDSTKIALPYGADGAVVPVRKFRDVQKLYAAMKENSAFTHSKNRRWKRHKEKIYDVSYSFVFYNQIPNGREPC